MDGVLSLADGEIDSLPLVILMSGVTSVFHLIRLSLCGKCYSRIALDFLICSGESFSLRELVLHVFGCMGVSVDALC